MLFRDVITLLGVESHTVDDYGDVVLQEADRREVLADEQSIRQSEFYQAAAEGFKPSLMFVIRAEEYRGEKRLEHNGTGYRIIRTYKKGIDFLELVCEGVVNLGSA